MAQDVYGYDADLTRKIEDNPFFDGLDTAHPAWWRGNDQGREGTARALHLIAQTGKSPGHFGCPEMEAAAQAILVLHRKMETAQTENAETQAIFDLSLERTTEAVALWKEAHPDRDLCSPDMGVLIQWLIARADTAEQKSNDLLNRLRDCETARWGTANLL